ncbi:U-scoloptoxin(05)-Er2a-like [Macrobrachium rosenbergii]|uniref:U-scoloptoxin(05)-Er2a-like n=1 Tax=Macrobrachium rosenbergii TaxID=79674 RepID=UPI0034D644FB
MQSFVVISVILCAALAIGSALKCYECEGSCKITDCGGSCVDIVTSKNDEVLTRQRHCWPTQEDEKCVTNDLKGVVTKTCYCNTDGCNAGSITSMFGLLLVMPLIISFISFYS